MRINFLGHVKLLVFVPSHVTLCAFVVANKKIMLTVMVMHICLDNNTFTLFYDTHGLQNPDQVLMILPCYVDMRGGLVHGQLSVYVCQLYPVYIM